jgi:copper chaperone
MAMEKTNLSIPNISCNHCVSTIQRELGEIEGVDNVAGDPSTREITVQWGPPATLEDIKSTLKQINYSAAD